MENIFLKSLNDLNKDNLMENITKSKNKKPYNNFHQFDRNILIDSKRSFDENNNKLNILNEEILDLKKLTIIPEKDRKIEELQSENEILKDKLILNDSI